LENYGGSCNGGKTGIFSFAERLPHPVEKTTTTIAAYTDMKKSDCK